ncbi:HAMP domain-containing histidine kinase [Paraglaciecola aquimarina]|uniref:histidine kinase n=1 Tax=Paraglaciecola algarum TaxID=3050085 RepID=A0ABS9D527_9ALTE|nr:HAMP domain-containing sensor histidine kinase [Paraglaciecola sp. G1-23]MCF2947875.1 HAMP domain-containing histidine kinase [Paraglaciecola sp. G1-23]
MTRASTSSMRRIFTRLLLAFFTLQLIVGLIFVVKSFLAGQEVLHSALLTQLANDFIWAYQKNPNYTHANTPSFSVYLASQPLPKNVSASVEKLPLGLHIIDQGQISELEQELQVLIVAVNEQRIIFVSQVSEPDDVLLLLDKTLGFLLSYLFIIALLGLVSIWLLRRHLLHPLQRLINNVDSWDFDGQPSHFSEQFERSDLRVLACSLDELSDRLAKYVKRERKVTRNISHELRTPITVIRSTLDMMVLRNNQLTNEQDAIDFSHHIAKLKRACSELESIIHAILWLGREKWPTEEAIQADLEIQRVIEDLAGHPSLQGNEIACDIQPHIKLYCPDILFRILLSNLIRNALEHGQEKSLVLQLTTKQLSISNTQNKNIQALKSKHFGLGLDIVKQICKRVGWRFEFCVQDEDVQVTIRF